MPERVGGVDVYPAGPGLCELDPGYGAARLVAQAAASPCTPETVAALARIDPASLDPGARVDLIVAWERAASMVAAHQQRALASVVDATTSVGMAGEAARFEVGAALRLSPHTAADRTMVAAALTGPLTDTLDALASGRISYLQAAALATTVDGLDPDVVTTVQDKVLDQADDLTVAETRTALRRAVIAADPEAAADRYQKARKERSIDPYPLPDAMTGWWVTAPAADADAAFNALTARAHTAKHALQTAGEDDPGIDALRVDVLLALTTGTALPGTAAHPSPAARTATRRMPRQSARQGCRGAAAADDAPPRSSSTCPPCSASPTTPASSPATDPSPQPWPASSPPTPTGPAGPPTRTPAPSSTPPPTPTDPDPPSPPTSPPATAPADSPAATAQHKPATSTTSSNTPSADAPSASTSDRCAAPTTTPKPTAAGDSNSTRKPATKPGPAPSARPTANTDPNAPATHPNDDNPLPWQPAPDPLPHIAR